MRQLAIKLIAAAGFLLFAQSIVSAVPLAVSNPLGSSEANPLLQDVRLYCMNARTGRFLYWGRCRSRYVYRSRPRYRYYCRNRYTGRFIHWGRC